MKNRNMPAEPIYNEQGFPTNAASLDNIYLKAKGLTKLETAAIAAMQGLLSKKYTETHEACARFAVKQANALFDELEKDND